MCFPQKFHEFIDIQNFPVTQILIAWGNKLILTGLWINRLQIIIISSNTLLGFWWTVFFFPSLITYNMLLSYLRNRKHVPCFYRSIESRVKVWENEKYCGNTSRRRVFLQLFRVQSQTFTSVSIYIYIVTISRVLRGSNPHLIRIIVPANKPPEEIMTVWTPGRRKRASWPKDFVQPFFLVFFRVTHDWQSERGTSYSLTQIRVI